MNFFANFSNSAQHQVLVSHIQGQKHINVQGGLQHGHYLQADVIPCGQQFAIDFISGNDIVFHFNPRFNTNKVFRNSRLNGGWGSEEFNGGFPFQNGQEVKIQFLVEQAVFRVLVDGAEFVTFAHRHPINQFNKITTVEVTGEVEVRQLQVFQVSQQVYSQQQAGGFAIPTNQPGGFAIPTNQPGGFAIPTNQPGMYGGQPGGCGQQGAYGQQGQMACGGQPGAPGGYGQPSLPPQVPQTRDVEVGPIWDQADAETKAHAWLVAHPGYTWTGVWRTTVPNKQSVINVRPPAQGNDTPGTAVAPPPVVTGAPGVMVGPGYPGNTTEIIQPGPFGGTNQVIQQQGMFGGTTTGVIQQNGPFGMGGTTTETITTGPFGGTTQVIQQSSSFSMSSSTTEVIQTGPGGGPMIMGPGMGGVYMGGPPGFH